VSGQGRELSERGGTLQSANGSKLRRSASAFAILSSNADETSREGPPLITSLSQNISHAIDASPGTSSGSVSLPSPHNSNNNSNNFNSQTSKHQFSQSANNSPMKYPSPTPKKKSKRTTEEPEPEPLPSKHATSRPKPSSRSQQTIELLEFNDAINAKLTEKYRKPPYGLTFLFFFSR
jgi:hypothetical protein